VKKYSVRLSWHTNSSLSFDVKEWLDLYRICKVNTPAGNEIAVAFEENLTAYDISSAKK
tara:strand:+ start:321 stop:497 length:177 start_codon:yes stop_codon:yes gene_type:complete